jgi:hypothetical protein
MQQRCVLRSNSCINSHGAPNAAGGIVPRDCDMCPARDDHMWTGWTYISSRIPPPGSSHQVLEAGRSPCTVRLTRVHQPHMSDAEQEGGVLHAHLAPSPTMSSAWDAAVGSSVAVAVLTRRRRRHLCVGVIILKGQVEKGEECSDSGRGTDRALLPLRSGTITLAISTCSQPTICERKLSQKLRNSTRSKPARCRVAN